MMGDSSTQNPSWENTGAADPTATIDLFLAVKQTNVPLLEETLLKVSRHHQSMHASIRLRIVLPRAGV